MIFDVVFAGIGFSVAKYAIVEFVEWDAEVRLQEYGCCPLDERDRLPDFS